MCKNDASSFNCSQEYIERAGLVRSGGVCVLVGFVSIRFDNVSLVDCSCEAVMFFTDTLSSLSTAQSFK